MEIKLTEKDKGILFVIEQANGPIGPTQIGIHFGKKYISASAWCSLSLSRLIKAGKITREKGKYSFVNNINNGKQ